MTIAPRQRDLAAIMLLGHVLSVLQIYTAPKMTFTPANQDVGQIRHAVPANAALLALAIMPITLFALLTQKVRITSVLNARKI